MIEKWLMGLGAVSLASTEIKETVSVYSYKLWVGSQYHIDMFDIARTVGFVAGGAAIIIATHKIVQLVKKWQELKRQTENDK